jgi:hypothetical protein
MKRVVRWGLGSLGVAVVLVAVAHLPFVSGWLGWNHHGSGSCPFGYGKQAVASAPRPPRATPGPAALGFQLGTATRRDVDAWAAEHAVDCHDEHGQLACTNAPGNGGLDIHTMWFAFAADDTLVQIRTVRKTDTADALAAEFHRASDAVAAIAGAPAKTSGDPDPATLALGLLRSASAEFQTADFRAVVRAANLGARGYVLTESYAI